MTALVLVASLIIFLPAVALLHRLGQARVERRAKRTLPTQGIALEAVLLALLVMLLGLGWSWWQGNISAAWTVWAAMVVFGLGYCYWLLVCLTESGRRYMIAELIDRNPGLTPAEIVARYNRFQIIAARLERLEYWGTLMREGDRYRARPSLMLLASSLVRFWAWVLGFAWTQIFKKESSHS